MAQQGGFVRRQVEPGRTLVHAPDASSRHLPSLRYPFIPACAAMSVRGSSSGRRSRSPPTPAKPGPRSSHMNGTETIAEAGPYSYTSPHDRNAHRIRPLFHRPAGAGRRRGSHLPDHGLTGTTRARPGLDQALAAVREGDTLVVPKLDRLARSVPDARAIADRLRKRGVKLALGRGALRPGRSHGQAVLQYPRHLRRVRSRSHPHAHPRGHGHRPRPREIARQAAQTVRPTAAGTLPHACHGRVFHQRSRRTLLRLKTNRLSHTQPAPFPLAYDPAPYRNRPEVRRPSRGHTGTTAAHGRPVGRCHRLGSGSGTTTRRQQRRGSPHQQVAAALSGRPGTGASGRACHLKPVAGKEAAAKDAASKTSNPWTRTPTPTQLARWKAIRKGRLKGLSLRAISRELGISA